MRSFLSLLFFVMCCVKGTAQTYIEPVFDRTDVPSLHITKIEVTKDTTFVHCIFTAEAGSWARISKDTYLYDHDKNKKYTILRCFGLPFSPQQRDFRFGESVQIVFFFPGIGKATKLDFIEDPNEEAFNIYGINLKEHYENVYKKNELEHFSRMSSMFDNSGNTTVAVQYKKKEIEAASYLEGGKSMTYLCSLIDLRKLYVKYGFHQDAVDIGEKVKQIFEPFQAQTSKYADFLCDMSKIYSEDLNFEKAIPLQENACIIYEKISDWLSLAESLNRMGDLYKDKRDIERAELCVRRALDVLNKHDKAEESVKKEIELSSNDLLDNLDYLKVINDRILINKSTFYGTLSRILREKGDITEAIEVEKESLEVLKELSDAELYMSTLSSMAILYYNNGDYNKAIDHFEHCLKFYKEKGDNVSVLGLQLNLALNYLEKGDTLKAIQYTKEALETTYIVDGDSKIDGLCFGAMIYWKSSKYEEAECYLSEGLDYLRKIIQLDIARMTSEQKQRMWNKYRNLFIVYRDIVYKGDKDGIKLSKLYNYVLFSKNLLLDSDSYEDEDLSVRLNITWKDIQKTLSDDDIAIEFIATIEERTDTMQYGVYHALIVDKYCQYPHMITLIREKELIGDHEDIGGLMWKPILTNFPNVKNIYFSPDGVWHAVPIENYYVDSIGILSDKYNMYRLSSTKELVKQHKELKIERAVLYGGLTYSIGDIPDLVMVEGVRASFLRGIKERGGFEPLYNTLTEATEIQEILEQRNVETILYTKENGTEESFKQLADKKVNLIHLATHGMYVDIENIEKKRNENNFNFLESIKEKDPVSEDAVLTHSFLVMSDGNKLVHRELTSNEEDDGILTAKEISKLDLKGLDLVVLSACETALGEMTVSDGIFGLQRGFKKAGAKTILMNSKKVDDEAAKVFMVEFYKNLMNGESKLQSLKDARRYLIRYDNGKYVDPKYWQYFIMLDGLD